MTWWEAGGGDQGGVVGLAPGLALAATGLVRAPAMKPSNGSAGVPGTLARQVRLECAFGEGDAAEGGSDPPMTHRFRQDGHAI